MRSYSAHPIPSYRWSWVLSVLVVLIAGAACSPQVISEPPTATLNIETQVAGTLQAASGATVESKSGEPASATPALSQTPEAGQPEQPTAGADQQVSPTEPAQEPDAVTVVYARDAQVWLWRPGESSRPLTEPGGRIDKLILSSDGQVAAFSRQVDEFRSEIWAVNTDGSNERRLVSVGELTAIDLEALAVTPDQIGWIPGSHIVAYNTSQIFEGPGAFLYDDLRYVNADSLDQAVLLPPGQGGRFYFSPDGGQIALVTPEKISLIHTDGSNRREGVLAYEPVLTYSEYHYYPTPVWAPDGSRLLVAIPPADPLAEPSQPTTLWQVPDSGEPATQIGSVVAGQFLAFDIAYSPDLSRLAYVAQAGDPNQMQRELHLANPDGSGDAVYHTGDLLEFQRWSPGSARFLFVQGQDRQTLAGAVSEPATQLSGLDSIFDVRWVDADRFLYYQAEGADTMTLRLGALDGTSITIDQVGAFRAPYGFSR